jgi:hypothetical protein
MGFYAKDGPAHPVAERPETETLSRVRKPQPRNAWPPILTVGIGHRFYSPTLGRFLNPDPLSEEGGANFFSFVFDSPVNQIDPLGLFGCTPSPPADPPGKPADCDKPCSCDRPDGSKGVLKCQHVSASYTVTGGWTNFWNHQKYKWMKHPPDRIGKPEYWNPTYCFDDPKCPDGWNAKSPHYYDAQSGTDISAGGGNYPGAPDHDGKGRTCFEMSSAHWTTGSRPNRKYGRWCTKCE